MNTAGTTRMQLLIWLAVLLMLGTTFVYAGSENSDNTFFGMGAGTSTDADTLNSFFGANAGNVNTSGEKNVFVGHTAGLSNSTGNLNTFVGYEAGKSNTTKPFNTFIGYQAGRDTQTNPSAVLDGSRNTFVGSVAGLSNTTGRDNSFFGHQSGRLHTTGNSNSFFGSSAGDGNLTGGKNSFFGQAAGNNNNGDDNTFVGNNAGFDNTTGDNNSIFGAATALTDGLTNATAIGFRAKVELSNAMVLGSIPGVNEPFGTNEYVDIGIGTSAPMAPLHIRREDGTLEFLRLESADTSGAQDRAMMDLTNNGGIRFQFTNALTADAWRFQAGTGNNDNFEITKVGTGKLEMVLQNDGDLIIAGALTQNSDVNSKQDIEAIDGNLVLAKLDALPISEWTYKRDKSGSRHLGPMAQDFHKAFGLGEDETKIAPGDMAGIGLAAIKALRDELEEKSEELAEQKDMMAGLKTENAALNARITRLEELLQTPQP